MSMARPHAASSRVHNRSWRRAEEDTDRSAEALLRMRSLAQNDLDQRRCLRPDLVRSSLDAFRRPVGIAPVAGRHMLAHCRVAAVR